MISYNELIISYNELIISYNELMISYHKFIITYNKFIMISYTYHHLFKFSQLIPPAKQTNFK